MNETNLYYFQVVIRPVPEIDWAMLNAIKYKYYYNYMFDNGTIRSVDFPETSLVSYSNDGLATLAFDKDL